MERQQEAHGLVIVGRAHGLALFALLGACGGAADPAEDDGERRSRPAGEERVHVLVGRRGDVAFFLYPHALLSGYDRRAFAQHAAGFGIPEDRLLLRLTVFHLAREGPTLRFDPREVVLRFRGVGGEALAIGLASLELDAADPVRAPILRAWEGGPVTVGPGHVYHADFLLDSPEYPAERRPPLLHGSFEVELDGERTEVYLADTRFERQHLLGYLRRPGRYLLDLEPVKRAFRAGD